MRTFRYLLILSFSLLIYTAQAQTAGDSLQTIRNRQVADSILKTLNGRQTAAPVRTKATSPDTPASQMPVKQMLQPEADTSGAMVPPAEIGRPSETNVPQPAGDSVRSQQQPLDTMRQQAIDNPAVKKFYVADSLGVPTVNPAGAVPSPPAQPATPPKQGANPAAPQGPPAGFGGMKMAIGRIYGKVIDNQKKPVSYAAVSLKTLAKDSLIGGQLTEDNGEFSLTDLPFGAYNLKITYIGYKEIVQKVIVTPNKADQDVGDLLMVADATKLKEIDVTGQKSNVELKVDRKVFNVGADISARGGTGLDVMKNIPSVSIDGSGNVTLRNNTPQVYIDGRPTTLTLEQIPADQIDRVEVITNPSAKFEASSSGGIINVVMKKNGKPGYNGIINANIATNIGYNGLAMLNLKQKKFGVSLMYTVNGATNNTKTYNNTQFLNASNVPVSFNNQDINSRFKRIFQVAKVGFDFYINNRNTLSISENAVFGNFNNTDNIDIYRNTAGTVTRGNQLNTQMNHFQNFTTDVAFKHTYPKEGKEYTLDVQYNFSRGGGNSLYTTTNYLNNGSLFALDPTHQILAGAQHAHMITAQWDITLPIGTNMKIETGVRANYKLTYTNNNVSNDSTLADGTTTIPDFNLGLSNNYKIDDLVTGAYITFTHQVKDFSYQLGFRAEQVYYKGTTLLNGDSSFSYQYPTTVSSIPKILFPSFNLSQKWGTKHELQLNVARKVNRPNFFQIAPFIFSSNSTTVLRGNPSLQPEFINQGEINYNLAVNKVTWLSSIYGRYTEQPITSYLYPLAGSENMFVSTSANGSHSVTGGWENTLKLYPVKKLDITLTGNVFYTDIVGGAGLNNASNAGWSWLAKAIISYKFPLDITAQANGTYEAPRILPQGKTTPMYYFDLSLSKDFGFVTLNLTVSDVLNSRINGQEIYQGSVNGAGGYAQQSTRRRDSRFAKLGVSFRFGKMDASFFKKKKTTAPQGGGDDMGF